MRAVLLVAVIAGCGGADPGAHQCAALLSVCAKASDCCSGLCTPTANGALCACLAPHDPCSRDEQCCTGSCNAGSCACASSGASCGGDSDCCSGVCSDGVCSAPPDLAQAPDLAPPPPCDPVAQTHCGPGEACYLDADGSPACEPAGTVFPGDVCDSSQCVAGSECVSNPDYLCRPFCNVDNDCRLTAGNQLPVSPSNVAWCNFPLSGSTAKVCTLPCNPVSALGASGCVRGKCSTFSFSAGTAEYTDCGYAGSGVEGASCNNNDDCGDGLNCFSSQGGPSHCRRMCRQGNDNDCAAVAGTTCQNITGWTQFGACCPSTGC